MTSIETLLTLVALHAVAHGDAAGAHSPGAGRPAFHQFETNGIRS
ncbi:hypothetical protein [Mycolicibacterium thermoresistibile]